MSRSVNKVLLIGNLGKDAEQKFLPSGSSVANFSIATSRKWKDKQSGDVKEETEWHNVTLFGSEGLVPFLTKGKTVYIDGRLKTRSYEKDGQKHYVTDIVAQEVVLLGGGEKVDGGMVSQPRGATPKASWATDMGGGISDSDVPF